MGFSSCMTGGDKGLIIKCGLELRQLHLNRLGNDVQSIVSDLPACVDQFSVWKVRSEDICKN